MIPATQVPPAEALICQPPLHVASAKEVHFAPDDIALRGGAHPMIPMTQVRSEGSSSLQTSW